MESTEATRASTCSRDGIRPDLRIRLGQTQHEIVGDGGEQRAVEVPLGLRVRTQDISARLGLEAPDEDDEIPARPFLGVSDEHRGMILDAIQRHFDAAIR